MLREYVVSRAMPALAIPTTRSLAVVAPGRSVRPQTMLPGAVLARVASRHLCAGSFHDGWLSTPDSSRPPTVRVRLIRWCVCVRWRPGAPTVRSALLMAVGPPGARPILPAPR